MPIGSGVAEPFVPSPPGTAGSCKPQVGRISDWGTEVDLPCAHRATYISSFSLENGLHGPHCAQLSHPPSLARRDVPLARARAFGGHALREHKRLSGSIPSSQLYFQGQPGRPSIARVERARLYNTPSMLARFSLLEGRPCWSTCGCRTRPFQDARSGSTRPIWVSSLLPLMPQSSPGNGTFSFFLIMLRIMNLLPDSPFRQRPIVEAKPVIREAFQKFQLVAGPFQILAEGGGKLASHICIEHDRFGKRPSERCLMECRDLSTNLRDRGIAGTQMVEYIVKPQLRVIVK